MGDIPLADRRKAVLSVLDDAAKRANIPRELLGGIWGKESTFGLGLTSSTGCKGDFQFTRDTWADMIRLDGAKIAAGLRASGHDDLAATVEDYNRRLNDKKHPLRTGDHDLQELRDNPYISAYASAYLIARTARYVSADPWNKQQWGSIYAGYNIGPEDARSLSRELANTENCKTQLRRTSVKANPTFFVNRATGTQALKLYQDAVEGFANKFAAAEKDGFAAYQKSGGHHHRKHSVAPAVAPGREDTPKKTAPTDAPSKEPAKETAKGDYFSEIIGKYMGDGKVHHYHGTTVKYGICQSANPDIDVAHLTREQALDVYRNKYWNGIKGIDRMSREEAAAAFDVSYRHGPVYANRVLHHRQAEVTASEKKPEPLKVSFERGTDPAKTAVASNTAAPPEEGSLSSRFLRSAVHYVSGFFMPGPAISPATQPFYI